MTLKERTPVVLMNLAQTSSFAAIYPKEIAEKFPPATKVTEFIGTGPYRFAEWKPDQYVRVARFDGYKPRTEKANGYGGDEAGLRRRDPLGARCPTWPAGSRRWRPASWTTPTTSAPTPTTGSSRARRPARSSASCTSGSSWS